MNTRPVRLGIIGSSGGSALAAAAECLVEAGKHVDWVVVTDRQCGLEDWARGRGLSPSRIDYKDAETFSKSAFETFRAADCTNILLFYTRRVASPLIDRLRVWNIHPSLLPAFPGFMRFATQQRQEYDFSVQHFTMSIRGLILEKSLLRLARLFPHH